MIQLLKDITTEAQSLHREGDKTLHMIDEWEKSQQIRYARMKAALDAALESLNQIA